MTPIEKAARSDAEFDGRTFEAMGRADRERYLARSAQSITAFLEAAAGDEACIKATFFAYLNAAVETGEQAMAEAILALKEAVNAGCCSDDPTPTPEPSHD